MAPEAALCGQLAVLQWLVGRSGPHIRGADVAATFASAAAKGHLDIVRWLRTQRFADGAQWDARTCTMAAAHGGGGGGGAGPGRGAKGAYTPTGLGVASHWTSNARSSPHIQSAASHWISNASSSLHSQSVGTATTTGVTRATEEEEGQEANGMFMFSKP
jgi:hypothetical protein